MYHTGRKFLDYQRCICIMGFRGYGEKTRTIRKEIIRKDNFDFRKRIFTAVSESDVETADNSKKKNIRRHNDYRLIS